MPKKRKTGFNVVVLVSMDNKPDRDRLRGILRFTLAHPEWNVLMLPGHPANWSPMEIFDWRPDGILTNEHALTVLEEGVRYFAGVPNAVLMDSDRPSPHFRTRRQVCVDNDNRAIGRLAAAFFLKRGFRHCAYVPPLLPRRWSDERAGAFEADVLAAGGDFATFRGVDAAAGDWGEDERRLAAWLKEIPKPCGLLVAHDSRADRVVRICARN